MEGASEAGSLLRRPQMLRDPPVHVNASFGLMGVVGVVVNIVLFIVDIVSDALLAYVLWRQAAGASDQAASEEAMTWFIITLCIIVIPMVVLNLFSLLWYWQNKLCLGDYCVLHKMSRGQVTIRVILHLLLLGPLIRYLDIMRYGLKMQREVREVEMGDHGAVMRRTPKGEVHAVLQMVISRDTAMLDMMHSFLQDAPQLVFQIFLLYRSPEIITGTDTNNSFTIAVQVWKVLVGVMAISWSLVSYQDELRRSVPNKDQLSCGGTTTCLFWRSGMVASRVIAIATFASIIPPVEESNHAVFFPRMSSDGRVFIPFALITGIVLFVHWVIMTVWIHAQNTTFCANDDGSRRPVLELLYNGVMGVVHIFCYINLKDTPSRKRMIFFYTISLAENTTMIAIWFVEMQQAYQLWFLVTMIFSVEALWMIGLCSLIGYYAFLHPDHSRIVSGRSQASWRE
ncbi:XK-related protein 9-like isoform X1 [Penaeus japonicus]|uniref:XK-related protein 9-like isoform X1 n=2 Tax=Penaeus japonicus TaxID=27405 RepID=UPI001C714553|nr:XK-related protein 9-like isoform X1 [Penaeus japonicus]